MFVDSRQLDDKSIIESEICIIGAGAAGITLAKRFAGMSYRVCLLESGGFTPDAGTTGLNVALNTGRSYSISRLRYFGGATNHWGGHCVPIRAMNFEPRPWIPDSEWPFSRSDLDPYYLRAHRVLGLEEFEYDAAKTAASLGLKLFPFDAARVETVVSRYNAVRFGRQFRNDVATASNITAYLFANVTSINRHPTGGRIVDVSAKTLAGNSFVVRARYYVLATGGIENARLLLISNAVEAAGLGNTNGLVGRFFMEHIWFESGLILPAKQGSLLPIYCRQHRRGGLEFRCHLALPENVIRQQQIGDFRAELVPAPTDRLYDSVLSARAIREDLVRFEFPDSLLAHLGRISRDPAPVFRRLIKNAPPQMYVVASFVEQAPNPDSRVTLSFNKDALGLNRAQLDWRLSEIDKITITKAQKLLAAEVGRSGVGRMRIQVPDKESLLLNGATGGAHHMGTTRMHVSPRRGVVDANSRIHGLQNLFVAGSSVFPSAGYSNPTLTIVALALRLGDHLDGLVNRRV